MLAKSSGSLVESGEVAELSTAVGDGVGGGFDETDDAPKMTQLPRVDPKSAFHLRRTPSSMPSSPVGNSMPRRRSSLKERRTSEGEWWEMSPAGGGGKAGGATGRRETIARVGERICPSA